MRVVVCMDEPIARQRITSFVEAHGGEVLAETDIFFEASDVAERFSADAVVVDVSVRLALGQDVRSDLERPNREYFVIMLADPAEHKAATWPRAVAVDRHDDEALASALERVADPRGTERRRLAASPGRPAAAGLLDTDAVFYEALHAAVPGDVIIAIAVSDPDRLEELTTVCRRAIRRDDHLLRRSDHLVAFLPAGDPSSTGAAFERIRRAWSGPEELHGVRRTIAEGEVSTEVFLDVVRALRESQTLSASE